MIRPGPGNAEIAAHPHSPGYRPNGPCGWLKDTRRQANVFLAPRRAAIQKAEPQDRFSWSYSVCAGGNYAG